MKKEINVYIETVQDKFGTMTILELAKWTKRIQANYKKKYFKLYLEDDGENLQLVGDRLETDKEEAKRLKSEKLHASLAEQRERLIYERLKAKYDPS